MKKKTVFISSTLKDLKSYRNKAWETLANYDVNIKGMEEFGARKEKPLETSLAEVEQSDIYIGIIGSRLGTLDEKRQKSITQLEYEKAYELDKDIRIFMIDEDKALIQPSFVERGENYLKLEVFKEKLTDNHTVSFFRNEEDFNSKLKKLFDDELKKKKIKKYQNEYIQSKAVIEKFLLLPKIHSEKLIKLKLKFKSKPFPASKRNM